MCSRSSVRVSLDKSAQESPYAVSRKALARPTWVKRFHDGQFRGFWGSSGPSQSTTLSFVSCSIAVWSGALWPSSDKARFSWADSKSAMVFCRGWCSSEILAGLSAIYWKTKDPTKEPA